MIGLADCAYPLAWVLFRYRPDGELLRPLQALAPVYRRQRWVVNLARLHDRGTGRGGVRVRWHLAGARDHLVDAWLTRSLLGPSRVSELERTRAIAVEDTAAALRRLERDLHDGAQVRLAAVAMNLGMAQEKAGDDALRELLDAAQAGVSGALADLRRIARGIHPPVLDSGLADALASLAATSPIPAQVRADLPERPSAAIETMAYFCAAELLANAIKHSSASVDRNHHPDRTIRLLRVRSPTTARAAPTPPGAPAWRDWRSARRRWTGRCACRARTAARPR